MRSSNVRWATWVVAAGLTVGCSPTSPASDTSTTRTERDIEQGSPPSTVIPCSGSDAAQADVAEVRRAVESGPLFQAVSDSSAATSCAATRDGKTVTLDYQFRDGSSLRATRDPVIEYTELTARLTSPPAQEPVEIMQRVERAAFSPDGCGIDWKTSQEQRPTDDPRATDRVYRGDTCNCQAVVRTDATARVAGLTFRSAC